MDECGERARRYREMPAAGQCSLRVWACTKAVSVQPRVGTRYADRLMGRWCGEDPEEGRVWFKFMRGQLSFFRKGKFHGPLPIVKYMKIGNLIVVENRTPRGGIGQTGWRLSNDNRRVMPYDRSSGQWRSTGLRLHRC